MQIKLKPVSMRCGKGESCEFYDKHNKVSGCTKFDDRRKCPLSMKQRRRSRSTSKRKGGIRWW